MKIAIVHDYLFQFGGGEKVVEKWLEMYPQAEIYTSFFVVDKFTNSFLITKAAREKRIKTSWLQKFVDSNSSFQKTFFLRYFKHFFWLYPFAMRYLTVQNYDLVLISSTYCGKNIRLENCGKIIHYCHSPTRFLHGLITEIDHKTINPFLRLFMPFINMILTPVDLQAVKYLNKKGAIWLANSKHIQTVIQQTYLTKSQVVYPPVETGKFIELEKQINTVEPYYYYFGRISFHKRIDLAILVCLELGRKLIITGTAAYQPEMDKLKQIVLDFESKHPQSKGLITFTGRLDDLARNKLLAGARAFLFPGKEDFGIAPIEALASGTPIIAYKAGGALEYVIEEVNGCFFEHQTVESVKQAILNFEKVAVWNTDKIRQTAKQFDERHFEILFNQVVSA